MFPISTRHTTSKCDIETASRPATARPGLPISISYSPLAVRPGINALSCPEAMYGAVPGTDTPMQPTMKGTPPARARVPRDGRRPGPAADDDDGGGLLRRDARPGGDSHDRPVQQR